MQIDVSDSQSENADSSIRMSREPDSKVTVESDLQEEKQDLPRTSTEAGMQIDLSEDSENTDSSM
jgi:hypothetical protein